MKHRA